MAIVMIMSWKGVTPDQYEALRASVDWEHDQPAGGRFHVAAFDAEGLRITDVWDTPEQFQQFVDDRLMPGVQELGTVENEPQVEIYPVHAVYSPALSEAIV